MNRRKFIGGAGMLSAAALLPMPGFSMFGKPKYKMGLQLFTIREDMAKDAIGSLKAAKAMGLPVCGVDMMRSERGPLVLEVNSSASIKTPELLTKRNVAGKIIEYIEQNAKQRNKKDRVGA